MNFKIHKIDERTCPRIWGKTMTMESNVEIMDMYTCQISCEARHSVGKETKSKSCFKRHLCGSVSHLNGCPHSPSYILKIFFNEVSHYQTHG